jgi:hypothetical protein
MEHITSYMAPTPLQQVSSTGKKLIGCGDSSSQKHIVDKVSFDPLISLIDVATDRVNESTTQLAEMAYNLRNKLMVSCQASLT